MLAKKAVIYCARALYWRGGTRSKTQSAIHAADFFGSPVFMHDESVLKHETGHEKETGQVKETGHVNTKRGT